MGGAGEILAFGNQFSLIGQGVEFENVFYRISALRENHALFFFSAQRISLHKVGLNLVSHLKNRWPRFSAVSY